MQSVQIGRRLAVALVPMFFVAACEGTLPPTAAQPAATTAAGGGGAAPGPLHGAVPDLAGLRGLTSVQLRAALGNPGFTRRDAPAEIWQYRGRNCTLDLFLYDVSGGGQTVAQYAVRSPTDMPAKDCFDELVGRSRTMPSS